MQAQVAKLRLACIALSGLLIASGCGFAQNPPSSHVIIPNPTPRDPDLRQEFAKEPDSMQKKKTLLQMQNELRAREVWLEANQILYLAQQLELAMDPSKQDTSMAANAAKAGEIAKLAKSMEGKLAGN